MTIGQATQRRARLAAAAIFGLIGALLGMFTGRVPALVENLALSNVELGTAYLVWGVGALAAMQSMRYVMVRIGSLAVLRIAVPLYAVSALVLAGAPTFSLLLVEITLFGVAFGATEASIHTQAALIERALARPSMAGMQAGWPIGAAAGGVLAAGCAYLGVTFAWSLGVLAVAVLPLAGLLPLALRLPGSDGGPSVIVGPADAGGPRTGPAAPNSSGRRIRPIVYLLGALAFAGYVMEDAVADWTGVMLTTDLGASAAIAALTYPVFQAGMVSGRLCVDRLRGRLAPRAVVIGTGAVAGAGVLGTGALGDPWLVLIAIFVAGVGISPLGPLAVSLTGAAEPTRAEAAIAQLGALGYLGMLFGPIAMGVLADLTGLRAALVVVAVLMGATVVAVGQLLPGRAVAVAAAS